jgi:CheY-like chemotaxis protein
MTLRGAAIRKAMSGETTFEEVLRVTQNETLSGLTCPACARQLANDMVVCPWCDIGVGRGQCPSCTRPLDPEWKVCPWCRAHATVIPVQTAPVTRTPDRPRVLVVDDDPHVGEYFTVALADTADVEAVGTASEALHLVATNEYDVAVIDQGLPDLSGVELIRLFRTEVRTALLPLLVFTGQDANDLEDTARLAGADDFITKPADPDLIEQRVLSLARRSPRVVTSHA